MNGFLNDFKNAWNKPNNTVAQIIIINVIVFAIHAILRLFGDSVFWPIYYQFAIPSELHEFIIKPWTILTYAFTHGDLWHILMNMLVFYWFGKLVEEYLGSNKVIGIYILGAIFAAGLYLIAYNFFPIYSDYNRAILVGASGSVYAIMVAAATLMPDFRFFLLFIGPVRIKYIALVFIFISFVSVRDVNAGGNLAHLGGALLGYLFVLQLRRGSDWSIPVIKTMNFFKDLFKRRPKIKVSHKKSPDTSTGGQKYSHTQSKPKSNPDQKEIDEILDKISEKGYESLTKEEKEKLFNASR